MAEATQTWQDALAALRQWAEGIEGIELSSTRLSVPRPLREAFYGRVEEVQELLAAEVLGEDLARAEVLAERLRDVRAQLCGATGLSRYLLAPRLEQFIESPRASVARPLQSIVLDGLCGSKGAEALGEEARPAVRESFDILVRCAYEAWAYLGVLLALDPVRMWAVSPVDDERAEPAVSDEVRAGWQVPSRELRLPEAVVRCADGSVYAVKMECAREIDYYDVMAPIARDTSAGGNTHELLAHRVLLLYRLADESAVAPVVHRKKKEQTWCDGAVSVLAPREMDNPAYLGAFIQRLQHLRAKRPVQVLTFDEEGAFPEAMADDPLVPAVERRTVGLREESLRVVADVLSQEPSVTPMTYSLSR